MFYPARVEQASDWNGKTPPLLTWDDLDRVLDHLSEAAPGWSAELNYAGPDESTIVVTPPGANDLIGPAFVLHLAQGRVHLDQFRWDEYRKLGAFRSLGEALAELRKRLAALASVKVPDIAPVRSGSR